MGCKVNKLMLTSLVALLLADAGVIPNFSSYSIKTLPKSSSSFGEPTGFRLKASTFKCLLPAR
jgi:hypothetical protein